MSVHVDTSQFERAFLQLLADMRNAAHQALVASVKAARDKAASTTLFKDGSGKLRQSIRSGLDTPTAGFVEAGGRQAPYAVYVENGTRPHDITGKRGGMLRFEIAGETFYRRAVHHPGTSERPFMAQAKALGEQTLEYGLEIMLERPIASFNSSG